MARRWNSDAVRRLIDGVGTYGVKHFQKVANAPGDYFGAKRSRKAIYGVARRQCGLGGLTRGVFTLRRFINATGFNRSQLLRARRALGQKWRRLGPGGAYLITEDQVYEILEWLKHDYWAPAKRLYRCVGCGTDEYRHRAVGLCGRCYFSYRRECARLGLPCSVRAQQKLVSSIVLDNLDTNGKILDQVNGRLGRGQALDFQQLSWLHMMTP